MPDNFARKFSLEATRPNAAEIAAMAELLPAGTPVYFSAVPTITPQELIAAAALLRKAGLEPVIHIAARRMRNAADLQNLLAGLRGEADVRRLLVIGGDVDAVGPFPDALAVIQKGRLREAGIAEIGIGAYPEGHSRIPAGRLEAALDEKIAAAAAHGLARPYRQPILVFARAHPGLAQKAARLRHHPAGQGRHGRPDQHARAVALRPALRRQRLAARPDVRRGLRPHRQCRAGQHRRNAEPGRRSGRRRAALFFIRRRGRDRAVCMRDSKTACRRACYGTAESQLALDPEKRLPVFG